MGDRTGKMLGISYRLLHHVRRDTCADVYLGQHVQLETQVTIYLGRRRLDQEHLEQTRSEVRTITHFLHPRIAPLIDFATTGGIPYFVIGHVPTGALDTVYPIGTRLPLVTVLSYVRQAADALHYAHERCVMHGTLTPGNLLLGQLHEVLISGFGLASLSRQLFSADRPRIDQESGGLLYLAPEQFHGGLSPASDQYALGLIVYVLLCGSHPSEHIPGVSFKRMEYVDSPSEQEHSPSMSPAVAQVVMKALAKDPQQRFPSVLDFARALEEACSGAPSASLSLSLPYRETIVELPLIGREKEQDVLLQWLLLAGTQDVESPTRGQRSPTDFPAVSAEWPHGLLLVGEAGIGKTRVAQDLGNLAREHGFAVAWSGGSTGEAYCTWKELVRAIIVQSGWTGYEVRERPNTYLPLAELLPELFGWLEQEGHSAPRQAEPWQLWQAVLQCLKVISAQVPLLLVFEDLQLIDEQSLELLASVVRRLRDERVLLLLICRQEALTAGSRLWTLHKQLVYERVVPVLTLQPLSTAQIGELITASARSVTTPQREYLQTSAAGNPLFAVELLKDVPLLESRITTESRELSPLAAHTTTWLPAAIATIFDEQLSACSKGCRRLLERAAALGASFELALLTRFLVGSPEIREETALFELIDEALGHSLLLEEQVEMGIRYHFRHPLLAGYLYNALSDDRRKRFKQQLAEILEETNPGVT